MSTFKGNKSYPVNNQSKRRSEDSKQHKTNWDNKVTTLNRKNQAKIIEDHKQGQRTENSSCIKEENKLETHNIPRISSSIKTKNSKEDTSQNSNLLERDHAKVKILNKIFSKFNREILHDMLKILIHKIL